MAMLMYSQQIAMFIARLNYFVKKGERGYDDVIDGELAVVTEINDRDVGEFPLLKHLVGKQLLFFRTGGDKFTHEFRERKEKVHVHHSGHDGIPGYYCG
jgi:hypothetical protein